MLNRELGADGAQGDRERIPASIDSGIYDPPSPAQRIPVLPDSELSSQFWPFGLPLAAGVTCPSLSTGISPLPATEPKRIRS